MKGKTCDGLAFLVDDVLEGALGCFFKNQPICIFILLLFFS